MANLRGRPATFADKSARVAALTAIRDGAEVQPSRFLVQQLIQDGFVVQSNIPSNTRGRPRVAYSLANKGKTYLNFSKNWKF